jgi:hypothetical protein
MKGIWSVCLGLLCFSCAYETIQKIPAGARLVQVKVNDRIEQSFEYNSDRLTKEFFFDTSCPNHPADQFLYIYRNDRLNKLEMTLHGFYSNSSVPCHSKAGVSYDEFFKYDETGRIIRISRKNSYSVFEHDADQRITKELLYLSNGTLKNWRTFSYDAKGNLILEIDSNGNKTEYEYDDKPNPFYTMTQRPQWISPFNKSPNNVIRATGYIKFERTLTYNAEGLPVEILETDGRVYVYGYR